MGGLVKAIFGDGGDAPPPPDYAAAARETAAGNLEAAKYTTAANRINQYTPYGSLTYTRKQPTFDQAGYDKAMQAYQSRTQQPGTSTQPRFREMVKKSFSVDSSAVDPQVEAQIAAPRREDFMLPDDGGGWEQRMELTPQAQATLDKQMALSDKYAETAGIGFDKARAIFENPNIDLSGMPEFSGVDLSQLARAPINPGMTAQEAILSRLNPSLANDEEALRTRLANQGIGLGSNAYTREMMLQGQRGTDLRLQAAAQGISLDQAARQQGLNEQLAIAGLNSGQRAQMLQEKYTQQSRPLDLINALRSGAQVQNPTFQPYAQQANVAGPDLLGATNQQYAQQMAGYNADQARQASLTQGLFTLGGAALMSPAGTFAGPGGLVAKMSDIRTKENIKQVGQLDNGLNVYEYTYKPEFDIPGIHVGVMAQEVIKVKPEAIVMRDDGYMAVNYAMI